MVQVFWLSDGQWAPLTRGTRPAIPNNPPRKRLHPFDRRLYKLRNLSERTISRLKDWRRIATRYDKLATNFLAAVTIAAARLIAAMQPRAATTQARSTNRAFTEH